MKIGKVFIMRFIQISFRVLIQKSDVFTVTIQDSEIILEYFTETSNILNQIKFVNIIFEQNEWHHVALAVCGYDVSLFIDGTLTRTSTLLGILKSKVSSVRIGQNSQGNIALQINSFRCIELLNMNTISHKYLVSYTVNFFKKSTRFYLIFEIR